MELYSAGSGKILHVEFERGEQFTVPTTFSNAAGTAVTTISTARLSFFTGSYGNPTAAFTDPGTVTVTVSAGTTMSFTLTSTQTRAFAVGTKYCWLLECTLADGTIATVWKGNVKPLTEVTT